MRVLVAEDEVITAEFLKKGLEQESYAVDIAYDGDTGLSLAMSSDFDLVILDLMLPKLSGIKIVEKMREDNINTPILIITAKGEIEDKISGLNAGADDYLVKPFAFDELLARMRAIKRRPAKSIGSILKIDDLVVDINTHEVKRAGRRINLSRKEFALLEYLLRKPNITLTKEDILTHVWSYDDDIYPNTVEAYISYLRRKIDTPFKGNLIHTVRGFGYRISADKNV